MINMIILMDSIEIDTGSILYDITENKIKSIVLN